MDALLGWDREALQRFRDALAHDPALAVAHAGAALCLFLDERFEEARAAAAEARRAAAGQTPRERSHVEALARLVTGDTRGAEEVMREHLAAWPRDLVIAQRLYFVWFWQGRFPEMLALTRALVRWAPGDSFALGLHAFALEQAGRCDEAVRVAGAALVANPRDAWAVHALAHALYELGAFDTGVRVLPGRIHPCTHLGWFRNHLLWHLALLHLSAGDLERASAIARATFERRPSAIAGDLHDAISFLWRLELLGRPPGARWRPFVEIARTRLDREGLLFHAVHLAMALAAGGDWATAERQLATLRARATRDPGGPVEAVVVPLVEGIHAFAAADYLRAVARLERAMPRLIELGGSRAQRDVFEDTMLEACFRAGDDTRARQRLAARLARRPDRYWLARRAGSTPAGVPAGAACAVTSRA